MGAGKVERDYREQLTELANLRDTYPDSVIPFIHIDPRREGFYDLFITAIEKWGFKGVKSEALLLSELTLVNVSVPKIMYGTSKVPVI